MFVRGNNYVVSELATNAEAESYWKDVRAVAALTVYTGCCTAYNYADIVADPSPAIASLHWSDSLKKMLRRMRNRKTIPSFSSVVLMVSPPPDFHYPAVPQQYEEAKRELEPKKATYAKQFEIPQSLLADDDIDYTQSLPPPQFPLGSFSQPGTDSPRFSLPGGPPVPALEAPSAPAICLRCSSTAVREIFGCYLCCSQCHFPMSLTGGVCRQRCNFCDEDGQIWLYDEKRGFSCETCATHFS